MPRSRRRPPAAHPDPGRRRRIVDCGRYPVKRTASATRSRVSATIFRDGHEVLGAARPLPAARRDALAGGAARDARQRPLGAARSRSTRSAAGSSASRPGSTASRSWREELRRKVEGGQKDLASELAEGALLLGVDELDGRGGARRRAGRPARATVARATLERRRRPRARPLRRLVRALPALVGRLRGRREGAAAARRARLRRRLPAADPPDRRDEPQGPEQHAHGASRATPAARGRSAPRRAATTRSTPSSARSRTSTASSRARSELGIEIALDFAIQCSPDHPWLKEHPEWFHRRPDGTLKYAENPPKSTRTSTTSTSTARTGEGSGRRCATSSLYWVEHGVRVFRVDNPHTKPLPFWEWLIARGARASTRTSIFLAEAFTRPAMMHDARRRSASASPTRTSPGRTREAELSEFMTRAASSWSPFYRPNFFVNTPDILHEYLQRGRPAGVRGAARARGDALADATASTPATSASRTCRCAAGSEEYLDSEKYEVKERQLDGPLLPLVARLNEIRRENPALQRLDNLTLPRDRERAADRLREADEATRVIVVRQPRPVAAREGLLDGPGRVSACRRRSSCRSCSPTRRTPGASAATTSASSPARAHVHARPMSLSVRDLDTPSRRPSAPRAAHGGSGRPRAARAVVRGRPALVQARGLLRDPHPRLLRRQRRRLGRPPRADREARLPAVARHRLHLAAADVPVAAPRRRLRHRRLLRDPPRLRHGRGLPRASSRRRTSAGSA